jgi:hypothetical protein
MKFGVCFFKVFQFSEKAVVFSIRNFWLGVLIIELVVSIELSAKFSNTVVKKHTRLVAPRLEVGE